MSHTKISRRLLLLATSLACAVLLMIPPLVILASPTMTGETIHVVQRGEYLSAICERYGVTMSAVMQANNIADANRIYIGQHLVIPSGGGSTYGTGSVTSSSYAVSGGCTEYYRVRPGDYLGKIALQFGVTVQSIQGANGIWSSLIFPGTRLRIPCAEGADPVTFAAVESSSTPSTICPLTSGRYLIRPGDTLLKIALRCGTSVAALRQANGLNSDLILIGQWLQVTAYHPSAATPQTFLPAQPVTPVVVEEPTPTPTRAFIRDTLLPTPSPSW